MNKKKVLHILDSANLGGAEVLMLDFFRNFSNSEWKIYLVLTGGGNLENDFLSLKNVTVLQIKRRHAFDLKLIYELKKVLKKEKISIIHTHRAVELFYAYFASFFTKIKIICTHHGYMPSLKLDNKIVKFLAPRIYLNIAVSANFLKKINKIYNFSHLDNFVVVHNGVDEKKVIYASKHAIRAELNIPQNSFLVGMIGNFVEGKDQYTLCKAMKLLKDNENNFSCVFVGGMKPVYKYLYDRCTKFVEENQLQNNIFFLGYRSDALGILKGFDAFIFSTSEDSFGLVLIEAMMAKIPYIASNTDVVKEIIKNNKDSILFNIGDPNQLAQKIIELKKMVITKQYNFNYQLNFASNHYSIKSHINNILSVYQKALYE